MAGFEQGHALVIGVGAYGDARWDVPTATRDAEDLAATLGDPAAAAYPPGNVELLLDERATLAGVKAALGRLADRARPESIVLISFTCHGAAGEDELFRLATHDVRFTADARITRDSGLSVADLGRALREIAARRVLLFINACFAGLLSPSLASGGIAAEGPAPVVGQLLPDEAGNELVNSGEGRAIIAAGRPDQRSYFLVGEEHSFFGGAVLAALRGGAGDLFELYNAVYREVSGAAARRLNVLQEPTLTLLQGVGAFPVAAGRGDGVGAASQTRPVGVVREVPPVVVNITQKSSVIDFGGATIMGDVRTGNVVQGDLTIYGDRAAPATDDEPIDPLRRLPILRARVEVARNVDEDARDEAALRLKQAERALGKGDRAQASQRIEEALVILRAMNNGYITSAVRKIEELARAL